MSLDKRITLGNILTIISFVVVGLSFAFATRTTSVEAAESVKNLVPKVEANTEAVRALKVASENRSNDMIYLTDVVRAIAVAVDAEIPIRDPSK